jgi:alkylated DNA repair dioxygenase AlkB
VGLCGLNAGTKVVLESGDLLVFGGAARMVYHGVAQVHSGTAPQQLVQQTGLRPGRLNLTFRESS